jgi:hypothetical protein
MSESTIDWPGKSGKKYHYWIHPIGTAFQDVPGNYVFAKEVSAGRWSPVYVGQTGSLQSRLSNHEKENQAKRNGATHIHAHTSGPEAERLEEELDLCRQWKPVCNELLA